MMKEIQDTVLYSDVCRINQITGETAIWKSRFPNLIWTHVFTTLRINVLTAIRWCLEMGRAFAFMGRLQLVKLQHELKLEGLV